MKYLAECMLTEYYNRFISASTTYISPSLSTNTFSELSRSEFHLLCRFQIPSHVVGKVFGVHWRLLEFCDFLHRTLHRFLVKLIQICHRSFLFFCKYTTYFSIVIAFYKKNLLASLDGLVRVLEGENLLTY